MLCIQSPDLTHALRVWILWRSSSTSPHHYCWAFPFTLCFHKLTTWDFAQKWDYVASGVLWLVTRGMMTSRCLCVIEVEGFSFFPRLKNTPWHLWTTFLLCIDTWVDIQSVCEDHCSGMAAQMSLGHTIRMPLTMCTEVELLGLMVVLGLVVGENSKWFP